MWGYVDLSPHYYCWPEMPPMEEGKLIAKSPLVWALFLRQTVDSNSFVILINNRLICLVLVKFLPFQI